MADQEPTEQEIYDYLHRCRYCDSFTGDDTTGCAGQPKACRHFFLDSITSPKWAAKYRYLFESEW